MTKVILTNRSERVKIDWHVRAFNFSAACGAFVWIAADARHELGEQTRCARSCVPRRGDATRDGLFSRLAARTDLVLWLCSRRLRLTIARDATLPFRMSGIAGGGGDASPKSKSKSVVSARAGATNDVATSEVATAFSARRLLSELPRLLSYLALLAQSQNKRNESNRGVLDARAQGPHEIPNARSLLQQPALKLSSGGAHRQQEHRRKLEASFRGEMAEEFGELGIARDRRSPPIEHPTLIFFQYWHRISLGALE